MHKLSYLDVEISCASWQWFVTLFSYNLEPEVSLRSNARNYTDFGIWFS